MTRDLSVRIEKFYGRQGTFKVKWRKGLGCLFHFDLSLWLYGFNVELDTGYWKGWNL